MNHVTKIEEVTKFDCYVVQLYANNVKYIKNRTWIFKFKNKKYKQKWYDTLKKVIYSYEFCNYKLENFVADIYDPLKKKSIASSSVNDSIFLNKKQPNIKMNKSENDIKQDTNHDDGIEIVYSDDNKDDTLTEQQKRVKKEQKRVKKTGFLRSSSLGLLVADRKLKNRNSDKHNKSKKMKKSKSKPTKNKSKPKHRKVNTIGSPSPSMNPLTKDQHNENVLVRQNILNELNFIETQLQLPPTFSDSNYNSNNNGVRIQNINGVLPVIMDDNHNDNTPILRDLNNNGHNKTRNINDQKWDNSSETTTSTDDDWNEMSYSKSVGYESSVREDVSDTPSDDDSDDINNKNGQKRITIKFKKK